MGSERSLRVVKFKSMSSPVLESVFSESVRTLLAVVPLMPVEADLLRLGVDVEGAARRGYLDAVEDERVLGTFSLYLRVRAALAEVIGDLEPVLWDFDTVPRRERMVAFLVAYTAACILMRSAEMLTRVAAENRVLHEKLDQGDPLLGIPRKQFTEVYRGRTDPLNYLRFEVGRRFAMSNLREIEGLSSDGRLGEVVEIFRQEHAAAAEFSKSLSFLGGLRYRAHSLARRRRSSVKQVTFTLFELIGRSAANLRNPFHRKAVTDRERAAAEQLLVPGDVLVTRHADAATNLFLPGFWPHAALYIGSEEARRGLGVELSPERAKRARDPFRVLEALRDGVRFRALESTLAVDCFAVIRPSIGQAGIAEALMRASAHEGKGYDFEFDFGRSDRLVCTEVIYRGFHGIGGLDFSLTERAGRPTLTAEDLLDMAVEGRGFEVVSLFGVGEPGAGLLTGETARLRLAESCRGQG